MPVRKLPKSVVKKLRANALAIERTLGFMENIDHRGLSQGIAPTETRKPGGRVRAVDVPRKFLALERVAIKRAHDLTAKETIEDVKGLVRWHNKKFKGDGYRVVEPEAHAIGKNLIAMAKTDRPTVAEILWHKSSGGSKRGKDFFAKLKEKFGVNEAQLRTAAELFYSRTRQRSRKVIKRHHGRRGVVYKDMLLLGFEKGEFVFMPLVDIF